MASIEIPKSDLPVLKMILELSDPEFTGLFKALAETKPTLKRGPFVELILKKLSSPPPAELREILRVIFILYAMMQRIGMSAEQLARDVAEACVSKRIKTVQFPSNKMQLLTTRITKLLSLEKTVAVTVKAFDVMTEQQCTFCSARVMSDIRPVFTDSGDTAAAAVVIHNLQIGFHEAGTNEHKELHVALDTDDLDALKEVIERAEKKTAALVSIINSSKLPYLQP